MTHDDELDRLTRAAGAAWDRLREASGCTWRGGRLCCPEGGEPTSLATMTAARVGAKRTSELVADLEYADDAVERRRRLLAERADRERTSRVA